MSSVGRHVPVMTAEAQRELRLRQMRSHVSSSQGGFTLLEAVIALAIVSLVAIGTLAAVGAQMRATGHARQTTEAIALAEDRMMAVRLLTAGELHSLPDSIASGTFAPPLDMYSWRTTVQPVSEEYDDGLYTVTVQIEWSGGAYSMTSRVYQVPWENW